MKKLELQSFGVIEMNAKEMKEIDGGLVMLGPFNIPRLIKEGVSTIGGWLSDAAHGIVDGFKDGAK